MLFNLIGNAIKFTFKGYIEIEVDMEGGQYLITRLSDSRIGIKPDEIDKLFKFFGKVR